MSGRTTGEGDATDQPPVSSSESGGNPDLLEDFQALWLDLRGLAHDHLQLVSLEGQQAGQSLAGMIIAALIAAALLISVWFGLMAAGALALLEWHIVSAIEAILLVVAANLAVILCLFRFIRRKSHDLLFPATVRSLQAKKAL